MDTQKSRAKRTKSQTKKYEQRREWIYNRMQELGVTGKSVLCVGAREKSEVEFFRKKGFQTDGIDLQPSEEIIECDMSKMLEHSYLKNKKYDIVFSSESIEHCLDLSSFIRGLNTICNKYFICMCPFNEGETTRIDENCWDCSIHRFMTERHNYKEFDQFRILTSEIYKKGKRLFFILKKNKCEPMLKLPSREGCGRNVSD